MSDRLETLCMKGLPFLTHLKQSNKILHQGVIEKSYQCLGTKWLIQNTRPSRKHHITYFSFTKNLGNHKTAWF